MLVGVVDYLHRPVGRERDVDRFEEALREVMERLPLAAVLDRAPRGDGPVVVQLPEQSAHATRLFAAPGVNGHLDRHRLLELREQELRWNVLRLAEIALEVLADAEVAPVVLLVPLKVGSTCENLLLRGERLGDLQRRKRLVSELGAEARMVVVVFRERRVLVPHVPVVHVALRVLLPAVAKVAGAAARRRRPVGARGVVFPHELALHLRALDPFAAVEVGVGARLLEPLDRAEALVVAAPHRDRRMVAEAAELVCELGADLAEERVIARIYRARAHHIVPNEDAQLVAGVVEDVLLVLPAAPDAEHVHVCGLRALEEVAVAGRGLLVFVGRARNPVRALHEEPAPVNTEDERELLLAFLRNRLLIQHLNLPEADLFDDLLAVQLELAGVEPLLARTVRPPERRIVYLELPLGL